MRMRKALILLTGLLAALSSVHAAPVGVTYTVSGSSGNWTLNFNVTNGETGTDQALYFFGVSLSANNVVGSPAGYDPTVFQTWTNSGLGGSNTLYNNIWLDASASNLLPGSSLSGFDVRVSDAVAPQSVKWFAFTIGNVPYTGTGSFGDPSNPGFEGVASPEPSTYVLLIAGFGGWLLARVSKRGPGTASV
jgi:hypothetical protein